MIAATIVDAIAGIITDLRGLLITSQSNAAVIREADRLEILVPESSDKPTDSAEYQLVAGGHVIAKR